MVVTINIFRLTFGLLLVKHLYGGAAATRVTATHGPANWQRPNLKLKIEVVGRWFYTCPMMSRRTIRIVALVLAIFIIGASTLFTYDVLLGTSITHTFVEPESNGTLDY